jgi:hypothetical protein
MTTTRARATRGGCLILLMTLTTATLLTGCSKSTGTGGGSGSAPTVASVDTQPPSPPATTDADSAADARPVWREDSTNEEVDRWLDAWNKCLYKHGVPRPPQGSGATGSKVMQDARSSDPSNPKYAAANRACASKEPEDYKDRLRRQDPQDYNDRAREFHRCLKAKHVNVTPVRGKDNPDDDPMIFSFPDKGAANGLEASGECEKKAFGSVK